MSKIYLCIISVICMCGRCYAQTQNPDVVHMVNDLKSYKLTVPTIDMTDYKVLDTASLHATYRMKYRTLPELNEESPWVYLDVGGSYVRFGIDDYYRRDSLYSFRFKDMTPSYSCQRVPCEEILFNIAQKEMSVFNRTTDGSSALTVYKEVIPEIAWTIPEDLEYKIFGYPCFMAQGIFGGREWTVWFTPELPVSFGPWKLCGLPGLILKAEESKGEYEFELIMLDHSKRAIKWYNCKYQAIDKNKWRKYEEALHKSPSVIFGDNVWFMYKGRRLDETWSIPYNPIERE